MTLKSDLIAAKALIEQYPARMGFLAAVLSLVLICACLPTPVWLS